jgi:hypothetical protein
MLDGAMLVWFLLTGASLAFVIWDSVTNGVTSWVQRAAWILVTAYTGPVGAFFYLLACRRPFPGGHDQFTAATWKQGLNSEMHCLAGDATGIIVAASIVPVFGLANGWDVTIEYMAGFVSGLFIFQALMMLGMYNGDYLMAVRKTLFAETVSMNFVMAGMIPTMVVLAAAWQGSENPLEPAFWFRMSLASIVGGALAYPINYWLVRNHLKHGCMTLPGADGPAHGLGHHSPESKAAHSGSHEPMAMENMKEMEGMAPMSHATHSGHDHHAMAMKSLPFGESAAWVIGSYAMLLAALWLTHLWVPIRFAVGD